MSDSAAVTELGQRQPVHRPAMDAVYRLDIPEIWRGLRAEPWYFWFFCGYLFFEYFRAHTIVPFIGFLPWSRMFILTALILVLVHPTSSNRISSPLTAPLLGYFAVVFASVAFAFDQQYALSQVNVMVNWLLLYVLFVMIVNTQFRFYIVLLLLLLAGYKVAQHGARSWAMRGFSYTGWGIAGPAGFFQNAGDLGAFMTLYIPWATAFYFGFRDRWTNRFVKWFFLFAPIAGIATSLATGQRSAGLALAVMGLSVVFLSKNRVRNLVAISMVALAAWMIVPAEYKERFETAGEDQTSESRLHYWTRGMEIYRDHPVIGVGYNNWIPYFAARYPGENIRYGSQEVAHSVPITVAVETGTLGLFFYYMLVVTMFVTNMRSYRRFRHSDPPFWTHIAIGLNVSLAGLTAASIFLSIAYYPFLWTLAGLTAALYSVAVRGSEPDLGTIPGECVSRPLQTEPSQRRRAQRLTP
jgi:putative inorganic carbon (hco3(-)) transporter